MPVCVSTEVMRSSDRWTIENLCSSKELMERAGKAIFEQVNWKGSAGIICGKGNNAGDGFVVASLLHDHGIECEIVLLYEDSFSEDGRYFFDKCVEKGIPVVTDCDYNRYETILDCIFGEAASNIAVDGGMNKAKKQLKLGKVEGAFEQYSFSNEADRNQAILMLEAYDGWNGYYYETSEN